MRRKTTGMSIEQLYWNTKVGVDVVECGSLSVKTVQLRYIKFGRQNAQLISEFIRSFRADHTRIDTYPLIAKETSAFAGGYFGRQPDGVADPPPFFTLNEYAGLRLSANFEHSSADLLSLIQQLETIAGPPGVNDVTGVTATGDNLDQFKNTDGTRMYPDTPTASHVGIFACMWYNNEDPVNQASFKVAAAQTVYLNHQAGPRRARMGYWAELDTHARFTADKYGFEVGLLKDVNFLIYPSTFTVVESFLPLLSKFPLGVRAPTTVQEADALNRAMLALKLAYDAQPRDMLTDDTKKKYRDVRRQATDFITSYTSATIPAVYTGSNVPQLITVKVLPTKLDTEIGRADTMYQDVQRELTEEHNLAAYIKDFETNTKSIMDDIATKQARLTTIKTSLETSATELKRVVNENNTRLSSKTLSGDNTSLLMNAEKTIDADIAAVMDLYWEAMTVVSDGANYRRFRTLGL